MLPVRFDDISSADILRLVEDKTAERKTLEYKEKLTIGTGDERAEFLADISSFANASGGDIIFGISDERDASNNATGTPAEIKPLSIESVPTEIGKIEQIIQNGIQPRLPVVQVKAVEIPGNGIIIIVRVIKSWVAPHMVTQSNRSRFYSRNSSTGKFQLDVLQEEGRGATWMFEDAYAKHKHWHKLEYKDDLLEPAAEQAAAWAEEFVADFSDYQRAKLPWLKTT